MPNKHMTPGTKRTIITSKSTGRRYFIIRSSNRPTGRRYYLCSNPTCQARVLRETDLFCRSHDDQSNPMTAEMTKENEEEKKISSSSINGDSNDSSSASVAVGRQIQVDEKTGARSYRDAGGRRRYLCQYGSCSTIIQRQSDLYCRNHSSSQRSVNKSPISAARRTLKRSSTSLTSSEYRSPFASTPIPIPAPMPSPNQSPLTRQVRTPGQRAGTHRSYRDASGKIRFLCSVLTCSSRVARQTDYFCRRHQLESENPPISNGNYGEKPNSPILENDQPTFVASPIVDETVPIENKRQKRTLSLDLSAVPGHKINIAATTLPEDQWADVLSFIRHFSSIRISTNLNVTSATTHLIVDDSEHPLHCTITKKIVQAAVRRHIFILSSRWLKECVRQDAFLDEHPFEMISDSHTALRPSMQDFQSIDSLIFPSNASVLYAFAIECRQCQGSINRTELIELIQLTGAQLFEGEQAVDVLIVLCDQNDKTLNKIKEKYADAPASTIKFVTSDFLLKSVIKFELQDVDKYAL